MSSKFQHRHYVMQAEVFASMIVDGAYPMNWQENVDKFADMFKRDNARFDRSRFLAACNGKPLNGRDKGKMNLKNAA